MIVGSLLGKPLHVIESKLILDVNGVGYELALPSRFAEHLRRADPTQALQIYVHTQVSETDIRLFGFPDLETKLFFAELLRVSGIGPQIALAIADSVRPEAFYQQVLSGEAAAFTAIKGIGKKTAERIVLEMRDRIPIPKGLSALSSKLALTASATAPGPAADVLEALIGLGYRRSEAEASLAKIENINEKSPELMLKTALSHLGKLFRR